MREEARESASFSSFAFAGRGQCEQSKPKGGVEKFAPLRPTRKAAPGMIPVDEDCAILLRQRHIP